MNYGETLPWNIITAEDTVYMVDFSLEPIDRMVHLDRKCKQLIWIDHHASSINDAAEVGFDPPGIRRIGTAGCELTWEYTYPDEPIPYIIKHLGRYDVWDHSDTDTLPIQYGMLMEDTSHENNQVWNKVIDNNIHFKDEILDRGNIIYPYQMKMYKEYADSYAFDATIENLRAIVINQGRCSSLAFESVWDDTKYDVMISYACKGDKVSISAYTPKGSSIDASELAGKFGGGGHKDASGWNEKSVTTFMNRLKL